MAIFRGRRVSQRGGAGAGRGDDPHSMPFHEWHKKISEGKGPRNTITMKKSNQSPYKSQHELNTAETTHNAEYAKRLKAERGPTDDDYR